MLKMLLSIRTHLNNETMGLGTKAMDHFDNSALDCGWDRVGTINPSEPQITNKVVAAHYNLTLLNGLENISDLLVFEKITKLYWEISFFFFFNVWEPRDLILTELSWWKKLLTSPCFMKQIASISWNWWQYYRGMFRKDVKSQKSCSVQLISGRLCYNSFEETIVSMNYLVIPVRAFINDLALLEHCIITGKHTPLCIAAKSNPKTWEYV